MPCRRELLATTLAVTISGATGCLDAVSGGFSEAGISLSGEKGEIVDTYDKGVEAASSGSGAWDAGTVLFNDSSYQDATNEYENAIEHYEDAQASFADAETQCREIGASESAGLCADAVERTGLMTEAARAGREAAQAGANGASQDTLNDHSQAAQEKKDQATSIELRPTDALAATLKDE